MEQLVEFEFQWWRDAKGYDLVDTPAPEATESTDPSGPSDEKFRGWLIERWPTPAGIGYPHGFPGLRNWVDPRPQRPLLPYRIVRLGGDLVPYRPLDILDDIFRAYVNLDPAPKAILDFVDRYGPLTRGGLNENRGDSLAETFAGAQHMKAYIKAQVSDDRTATRRLLAEEGELSVTGIVPRLSYDPGTRAPKLRFHIPDLQIALWLHMMRSLDSGTSLRYCEWEKCGIVFEAGAGTGRRADSKFCCDQHRIAYHSVHRTPRPATDKAPPRRRGRPRRAPA
jgi:hypothetical protein